MILHPNKNDMMELKEKLNKIDNVDDLKKACHFMHEKFKHEFPKNYNYKFVDFLNEMITEDAKKDANSDRFCIVQTSIFEDTLAHIHINMGNIRDEIKRIEAQSNTNKMTSGIERALESDGFKIFVLIVSFVGGMGILGVALSGLFSLLFLSS